MTSKAALKRLREMLDAATYAAVLDALAGATVYFPANAAAADREGRDLQLKDDFYSGKYDVSDLARKYDLSISRVYKILQSK